MDEIEQKNQLIDQNTKNLQDLNYQSQVNKINIDILIKISRKQLEKAL